MTVASLSVTCPSCGARGTIEGIDSDVVPERIKCGQCKHTFPYHPNRYDVLRQVYEGEQNMWPMKVTVKAPQSPVDASEDPEATRLASLAAVPTKRLLEAFRSRAGNRDNFQEGAVRDDAVIRIPGIWHLNFTGAEVRAELARREHVPNKEEGRARRRANAQKGRQKSRAKPPRSRTG